MKTTLLTLAFTLATTLSAVAGPSVLNVCPPMGVYYAGTDDGIITFASGAVLRELTLELPSDSEALPETGTTTQQFEVTVRMKLALGAASPAQYFSALATVSITTTVIDATHYSTEMLALDIGGGDLPAGVLIRESPTLASTGQITANTNNYFTNDYSLQISSFFDIFTEISLDDGATWSPADAAAHVVLQNPSGEITAATPNLPPAGSRHLGAGPIDFGSVRLQAIPAYVCPSDPTLSFPPPAAGESQTNQTTVTFDGQLSFDGGKTFSKFSAPATLTQKVTSYLDSGNTRYFDTEMLQLEIAGGSLPSPLMLRESPTKASTGRTSITTMTDGSYRIASFFDVFVELSLDGGANWQPARNGACVFAPPNTTPTVLFAVGDQVPTAGDVGSSIPADAVFAKVGPPTIGPTGAVAFLGKWTSKTGGSTGARHAGACVIGMLDASTRLVASGGGTVGGGPLGGGEIFTGDGDVTIDACSTAFTLVGTLTGGAGVFSSKHTGIVQFAFADNSSKIAAEVGQSAAPDLPDAQLKSIKSVAARGGSRLLFVSTLAGRGITGKNDRALCATDSAGVLHVVLREGVSTNDVVIGGVSQTLTVQKFEVLQPMPGANGQTRAFNRNGEVVLKVTSTDRAKTTGILHINLP